MNVRFELLLVLPEHVYHKQSRRAHFRRRWSATAHHPDFDTDRAVPHVRLAHREIAEHARLVERKNRWV